MFLRMVAVADVRDKQASVFLPRKSQSSLSLLLMLLLLLLLILLAFLRVNGSARVPSMPLAES